MRTSGVEARRQSRRGQRGSVAVAAIVALAVGLTVSVGMLMAGEGARASGHHKARTRAARLMAEAGIEYGYWQYCYNRVALPYTGSRSLSGGAFSVSVSDGNTAIQRSVKIVSTGTVGADAATVTRVFLDPFYTVKITGTVFTDPNYGGGAGRSLSASSGARVPNARVELYDASGNFSSAVVTDGSGLYTFASVINGASGTVRVVSGTVRSQRVGATGVEIPVQTFRTTAASGGAVGVTDHVGGEVPSLADAGSGSTTLSALSTSATTAQCIAPVTVGSNDLTQVDFGFNFNTVVNRSDAGQGSVRQFLLNANALSNTGLAQVGLTPGVDNAVFMLADGTARPGLSAGYATQFSGGVASIVLQSGLPQISDPVVLDASLQPGYAGTPRLELNGAGAGANRDGLYVAAGSTVVRGLIVNRFSNSGIYLAAGGCTISGCFLGTNVAGAAALANGSNGLYVASSGNSIGEPGTGGRNVISGNALQGVYATGAGTSGNVIQNCYVGVNAAGTAALANGQHGVLLNGAPNNTVGGTAAGVGNVIAGNTFSGVYVTGAGATGNVVAGNRIGTNTADASGLGNRQGGVLISSAGSNTIGGLAGRNVISGNTGDGIRLSGSGSNACVLQNNVIGANAAGTTALANSGSGVVLDAAGGNTVGGTASGAANLISGNAGRGLYLLNGAAGNVVQGNLIGTNAANNAALGNSLDGILVAGSSSNTFGSTSLSAGANVVMTNGGAGFSFTGASTGNVVQFNVIASNAGGGVLLTASGASTGNAVVSNSIYANTGLGIDLGASGVTVNNGTKSASLPNNDMDFPVFTVAALSGTTLTVKGYVGSASGQAAFSGATVQIFKSDLDPSGYGEGRTLLGTLTADASGGFSGAFPISGLAAGDKITATATDGSSNTSEFGANVSVGTAFSVNPAATFWRATGDTGALDTVAIDLQIYGILPGQTIRLQQIGAFRNNPANPDNSTQMIAVFSSTSTLLGPDILARVSGAIDAGTDFVSPANSFGYATDIPEDFEVTDFSLIVPPGARYLFVQARDSRYGNNDDPNGDYGIALTR